MPTLALIRHGQSTWNLANRFTGWWDADLTDKGEAEAKNSGVLLAKTGIAFDAAYTSYQTRAIRTLHYTLQGLDQMWIPETKHWRLNERHYGGLTGLNKAETAEKHSPEQVHIWRRSYDTPPPPMQAGSEFDLSKDPRYAGVDVPSAESLKMTLERVLPYWQVEIAPKLVSDQNLIIAAHGNSLRAIVKHLFEVSEANIPSVEIPTGNPLLIELSSSLKPTAAKYLDSDRAKDLPDLP